MAAWRELAPFFMDQGAWSSDEEDGDYDPGLPELCEDDSNCSEEEDGPGSDVELDDPEPTAGTVGTWVGLSPERKCVPAVSTGLLKEAEMDPTGAVCRLVVQNRAVSLAGLSEHAVQKLLGQQLCCGLPQYVDLARGHTMHCKLVEQFDGRGVVQYNEAAITAGANVPTTVDCRSHAAGRQTASVLSKHSNCANPGAKKVIRKVFDADLSEKLPLKRRRRERAPRE
jgi:hypothetical protein